MKINNITVNINIKERLKDLIWIVAFLAILKPEYLATFDAFDDICNLIRVVIFCCASMVVVLSVRISLRLLCAIGYITIPLAVTIINNGDIYKAISVSIVFVVIFMLFENDNYECLKRKVELLNGLLLVIVLVDIFTIFMFPNGLYKLVATNEVIFYTDSVWFLGFKNNHPPFFILACFTSILCMYFNKKNITYKTIAIIVHVCSFVGVIAMMAGSGIYSMVVYLLGLLLLVKKKNNHLRFEHAIWGHVGIFAILTTLPHNAFFINLFAILGKVGTMTKRSNIWMNIWERVLNSPLWGYGYEKSTDLVWLQKIAAGAVTSHNSILDMFFRGGIITAVLFVFLLFFGAKRIKWLKAENLICYNYIVVAFFVAFLNAQTEGFMTSVPLFMLLAIIANMIPPGVQGVKKFSIKIK